MQENDKMVQNIVDVLPLLSCFFKGHYHKKISEFKTLITNAEWSLNEQN